MSKGGWVGWKWMPWHTAERKTWHIYDIHIICHTAMYGMIPRHRQLPSPRITSRAVRAQCREYTRNTLGMAWGMSGTLHRSNRWRCKMCDVLYEAGAGRLETYNRSHTRPTHRNRSEAYHIQQIYIYKVHNIQYYHTIYNTISHTKYTIYNIIPRMKYTIYNIIAISQTQEGNHVI